MEFSLGNYWYLFLLLLLPVVAILIFDFKKWKKQRKNIFAENKFHSALYSKDTTFSKIFPALYLLGFLFLILAMVDFLSGKEEMKVQQKAPAPARVFDPFSSLEARSGLKTRF